MSFSVVALDSTSWDNPGIIKITPDKESVRNTSITASTSKLNVEIFPSIAKSATGTFTQYLVLDGKVTEPLHCSVQYASGIKDVQVSQKVYGKHDVFSDMLVSVIRPINASNNCHTINKTHMACDEWQLVKTIEEGWYDDPLNTSLSLSLTNQNIFDLQVQDNNRSILTIHYTGLNQAGKWEAYCWQDVGDFGFYIDPWYESINGLLAEYEFNSTSTFYDSHNSYEPLTNTSINQSLVTGIIGQAIDFEYTGSTQKANYTNSDFKLTSAFTVAAWVRPESFPDLASSVVDNSDIISGNYYGWTVSLRGNGSLQTWIFCGNALATYCLGMGGTGVTVGKWSHIVAAYNDTANTLKFYVNGTIGYTLACSRTPVFAAAYKGFAIGGQQVAGTTTRFDGLIDEVGIWNKELTATEIGKLYINETNGLGFPWSEEEPVANTSCDNYATNADWFWNMSDNCNISYPVNIGTGKISILPNTVGTWNISNNINASGLNLTFLNTNDYIHISPTGVLG